MKRQLELWGDHPNEEPNRHEAVEEHSQSSIGERQSEVQADVIELFVNPDRQFDFGGNPFEQWPAPEVNRNSISVDRPKMDIDGPAHRFEIHRHDYVEVFFGKDELRYGHVVGISHKRQQVRIAFDHTDEETWFDTACIYPAVENEPKRTPRRRVGQQVNESL